MLNYALTSHSLSIFSLFVGLFMLAQRQHQRVLCSAVRMVRSNSLDALFPVSGVNRRNAFRR